MRRAQTGFLRYYAAVMIVVHLRRRPLLPDLRDMTLSILIWLPLAIALIGAVVPRAARGPVRRGRAAWSRSGIAISFLARFKLGHAGLQFVTDKVWISALGIHYKLGLDGLNVALVVLTTVVFSAALVCASFREWDRPRVFYFHFGLAESRRARRVLRPGSGAVRGVL